MYQRSVGGFNNITSKEAFEKIIKIYGDTNSLEGTYNLFLKIKQDLERLEELEEENKLLNHEIEEWADCVEKNTQSHLWQVNNQVKIIERLEQENEKLKKVIEILKEHPMCIIDILRFNNYFTYRERYNGIVELSKGDFDLLKEVLGND